MFRTYGKAVAAVIGVALVVVYAALSGDGQVSADEWVQISIAGATAVGVYLVPLAPQYRWGKTAVAVVLGVLQVLATAILGGVSVADLVVLALAALTAAVVGVSPAVSANGVSSQSPVAPSRLSSR